MKNTNTQIDGNLVLLIVIVILGITIFSLLYIMYNREMAKWTALSATSVVPAVSSTPVVEEITPVIALPTVVVEEEITETVIETAPEAVIDNSPAEPAPPAPEWEEEFDYGPAEPAPEAPSKNWKATPGPAIPAPLDEEEDEEEEWDLEPAPLEDEDLESVQPTPPLLTEEEILLCSIERLRYSLHELSSKLMTSNIRNKAELLIPIYNIHIELAVMAEDQEEIIEKINSEFTELVKEDILTIEDIFKINPYNFDYDAL